MPDSCTCGTQLPPEALFCHKCGKPQRDVPAETEPVVEPPPTPLIPVSPASIPVDFHNPVGVGIGLLMASMNALLIWIPLMNFALWAGSGFLAVYLYRRRTGHFFTLRSGLRLGWITGVMTFAITTLIFTVTVIPA